MGHFTVLVIGENPFEQMVPFQDNDTGDCPKEYLQFVNTESGCMKQFEIETATRVKLPSGEYVTPWSISANKFRESCPSEYKEEQVSLKLIYKSFDDYMKDFHGYSKDEITNQYGYWMNPNARWNWYVLGGRWRGNFKIMPGKESEGIVGDPGMFGNNESRPGYVDCVRKGNIDWQGMLDDNIEEGKKACKFWELYVEGLEPQNEEEKKIKNRVWCYTKDFYIEKYKNKENYVRSRVEFQTWSVLKDGVWTSAGEWGWFGEEVDNKEKLTFYDKWIKDLSDETLLTVFDYHI